jgi:CRISPR/Cas system-associated protein Cas10 (large subunit of type III CRISPR-Cas system)
MTKEITEIGFLTDKANASQLRFDLDEANVKLKALYITIAQAMDGEQYCPFCGNDLRKRFKEDLRRLRLYQKGKKP